MRVIAAQGEPTSSISDKLIYNESELDLKDGKVVGWKIDPRSPLRVKLWPEGPVDTGLRFFTVGSDARMRCWWCKGTPSSFSQDRFDYGSSAVYFSRRSGCCLEEWARRGSVRGRSGREALDRCGARAIFLQGLKPFILLA